jgi:hypothetical protein
MKKKAIKREFNVPVGLENVHQEILNYFDNLTESQKEKFDVLIGHDLGDDYGWTSIEVCIQEYLDLCYPDPKWGASIDPEEVTFDDYTDDEWFNWNQYHREVA